jgi:uncharacterized membrane protein YedE/YeeE
MFLIEMVASFIAGSVSSGRRCARILGRRRQYAIALAVVGLSLQWRASAALLKGSVMGLFGRWVAYEQATPHRRPSARTPLLP